MKARRIPLQSELDPFALTASDALDMARAAGGWDCLRERAEAYGDAGRVAALAYGIAERLVGPAVEERQPCGHPAAVASFLSLRLSAHGQEVLGAIYVDTRNRAVSGPEEPYRGTLDRCAVEPRAILRRGLALNAAGFIMFHNHPSGDPQPSAEDLAFTRRCADAGEMIGIRLVDHLVIGSGGRFVSLRERGDW